MAFCKGLFSLALLTFFSIRPLTATINVSEYSDVIYREVAIIGGGSSGTYAAIRLLQNNKSVAVIEKQDRLGGHVNTFVDPVTGVSFDYGVIGFGNFSVVTNYFAYLGIGLQPLTFKTGIQDFANFQNGSLLPASDLPNATAQGTALYEFGQLELQYPWLDQGFDLPDPVPSELLIHYGEFLQQNGLDALGFISFVIMEGVGNILAQPTLYVMKYFPPYAVNNYLYGGELTSVNYDNQALYNAALAKIGNNTSAFLGSDVTAIERDASGVKVLVQTPSGDKLVCAQKLLIAIPPKLEKLKSIGLDLTANESALFSQWNNSYYWDMVIRNAGIPDNASINNWDPSAPLGIPPLPGIYEFGSTGLPGLHVAYYCSPRYMTNDEVKADVLATLTRISEANSFPTNGTPEFVGFHNHAPFLLTVSTEAIQAGFYQKANALQGVDNTWWTGAAWQTQDSSLIWNWTEYQLLPRILSSLD